MTAFLPFPGNAASRKHIFIYEQLNNIISAKPHFPKCFRFINSKGTSSSATANQSSPSNQIEEFYHCFPLQQLQKLTGNFDKSRIINRGAFCDVYKACINFEGAFHEVAIKKLRSESGLRLIEFKKEIYILCQLRRPNLISLIGFYEDTSRKILVLEYMLNGSLYDQLLSKEKKPLSWKKRLQIYIGVARGLHYLHAGAKRTIFHRDMQPVNILLDENFVPKLANFSYSLRGSRSMSKPRPKNLDKVEGTRGYIAPEYFRDLIFTDKCDIYSFGMVLLGVVCAMQPWQIIEKMSEQEDQNVNDGKSEFFEDCQNIPNQICKFLQKGKACMIIDPFLMGKIARQCWQMSLDIAVRCLLQDPNERPTMGEVEVELEQGSGISGGSRCH